MSQVAPVNRDRRAYRLTFPHDLQARQVQAWLQAVSGALRPASSRPFQAPALALELLATDRGLVHRLSMPKGCAAYVVSQLHSQVVGVRVSPDANGIGQDWALAIELGLTNPLQPLRIPTAEPVATSLLASLQGLAAGEAVLYQWVVTSARPEKVPQGGRGRAAERGLLAMLAGFDTGKSSGNDEVAEQRAKLNEPNFLGVLRVAAQAQDEDRAALLVRRMQAALAGLGSPDSRFKKTLVLSKAGLLKRIERASGRLLYSGQLSSSELAALSGWPLGSPHVAGLPQGRARQLPATAAVPRTGRVIGHSNFPGAERPIAISPRDATKHLHILGPTGTGKTTLLANLAKQDMQRGHGIIVLESKGDLYRMVLERVPRRRIKDVTVLDVNDTAYPVSFNVLNTGTSSSAVDELSALITGIYGDHGSVYAPMLMYYGLHALAATPGHTFIDLPALLTPQGPEEVAWRDDLVQRLGNRDVRQFWQRYLDDKNKERDRMAAPVHNRIWQLAVRPEIRNIIGQSRSSFTFEQVLSEKKILLINLNDVRVGESAASLTGTLLMNALWSAARTVKLSKPAFLYLDEFQDFVNLPVNAADMLAKCRSYGLGMVLAHQDLDQLSKVRGLEQAVLANARSKVVFQTSARDARVMQREFGRLVDEDDFINLSAYEAIVRVATGDGVSAPISITTEPPSRTTGVANTVLAASRTKYGRPVAQVEAEIENRRRVTEPSRKKPKVGPQKWG